MSRLHFKGGAWTNAEDEVLKAGLAQYGLRDWERVASMLTKKTATQCRERWENYLDPRLNIHEAWSLEEEEKLVELQSLFPNKFRLISEQLTRRTSTHYIRPAWLCEQRYLELKDEQEHYAKQQEAGTAAGESEKQTLDAFMAERRRRRNARKTHEERAARADTISGERFEREMLAMATSRLANQDQKKGLRKERQRQLEDAAFLAKLESNREGIESGTLSLRQSKKMRKALDEDRQASRLVDMVGEEEDAESSEGEGDAEEESEGFAAIDMYEDQQQAGLVKKQRVLMKDLTAQQRMIQQRQMLLSDDEGKEGEGGTGSGSRARAAITGVNQDLLKQLTSAGPSSSSAAALRLPLVRDRPSASLSDPAALAAAAQGELKSTLADLFAALPQASSPTAAGSALLPPPLPAPPAVKRPREELLPVPSVESTADGDAQQPPSKLRSVPLVSSLAGEHDGDKGSRADGHQGSSSSSATTAVADLFSTFDLPPPRQAPKTEAGASTAQKAEADAQAATADVSPVEPALVAFRSRDEEDAYVSAARQWVAVECEKAATAAQRTSVSASAAAPLVALPPAERAAAEALVARELQGSQQSAAETLDAVRAYVADGSAYAARVDVQAALHALSSAVAAQVREANALLQPLRQEWERVMAVAMLNPRQLHVLHGYVDDDGQLKGSAAPADSSALEAPPLPLTSSSSSSAALYVYEHLVNELTRARQASRFLASLRDREQLRMRRDLDTAEYELQQLQARERTLQEMYRQKRAAS